MANIYSDQYKQVYVDSTRTNIRRGDLTGEVKIARGTKTFVLGEAASGDVLHICKLPKGARIVNINMYTNLADGVVTIGTYDKNGTVIDADYFSEGTTINFSSNTAFHLFQGIAAEAYIARMAAGVLLDQDVIFAITFTSSVTTPAAKVLTSEVWYVDN